MPHTIKFDSRKVLDFVNQRMKYMIKLKRWETQEEVLIRLLKIEGKKDELVRRL